MELTLNKDLPEVRLRAFRAVNDPEACHKFFMGHEEVLAHIGIKKVTSSTPEWMNNPAAFVVIVESLDRSKVYGGLRIHIAGGTEPLPIEEATANMDPRIYDLVKEYARYGVGEVCGLWNSREIAGYGIGSIFLARAGVAISKVIGIKSLFSLCAPYTVKLGESLGYYQDKRLGHDGTFYYPKIDLIATVMIMEDVNDLSGVTEENRKAIEELRARLKTVRIEELRNKQIKIHYDMALPHLGDWDLEATIENALQRNHIPKSPNSDFVSLH